MILLDTYLNVDVSFGNYGTFVGQLDTPLGVSFTPRGELLVADSGNARVQFFTDAGTFRRVLPAQGVASPLRRPRRAVAMDDGRVLVADPGAGRVFEFAPDGALVRAITPEGSARFEPSDIAVARGGRFYVADAASHLDTRHRLVFLEDYDISVAKVLVAGVDVWLNNPLRPMEACGTSGMKAALNGVLNCSVLDGWWDEMYEPDVGWAIQSAEWQDDPDERNRIRVCCNCLLIRRSDRLALVDTGLGDKHDPKFQDQFGFEQGARRLPDAIRAAGFDPGDVTDVLCTHLHFDHAGWNTCERGPLVW